MRKISLIIRANCSRCDSALRKLGFVQSQRSRCAPGGSLLQIIETSIKSGNAQDAVHDMDKYLLIVNDLSPEHCAILQSAAEDLRRATSRRLSISKLLGAIWRLVGIVEVYLKWNNKNPLNSFMQ